MYKLVPCHSLVIAVGPNTSTRAATISRYFSQSEVISPELVSNLLVGERVRPDLNSVVFAEIRHLIDVKLSLGERCVVNAQNLRREDRLSLARIASENGVPVFYLLCDPAGADEASMNRFRTAERDILMGDGLAEVIDWRHHTPQPVSKDLPGLADLRAKYSGITVISDVHGMYPSLLSALANARARNDYVIFLGDVVDYGPDTLDVADEVYRTVMRGEGELLLGNHERKILRWITQVESGRVSLRLSDGNRVTTNALNALGSSARRRWIGRFKGLCARANYVRCLGNITMAHAGVNPGLWDGTASAREIENWALFGEFDPGNADQAPERKYAWVEAVPEGETVIVGHDIRSTLMPLTHTGAAGGRAIFLDTGSGKGGALTTANLRFTLNGLRVEHFNRY